MKILEKAFNIKAFRQPELLNFMCTRTFTLFCRCFGISFHIMFLALTFIDTIKMSSKPTTTAIISPSSTNLPPTNHPPTSLPATKTYALIAECFLIVEKFKAPMFLSSHENFLRTSCIDFSTFSLSPALLPT
jgi:hypothetical protein